MENEKRKIPLSGTVSDPEESHAAAAAASGGGGGGNPL